MVKTTIFLLILSISSILCWEALPQIPSGRRSQYLVLHENGGYKYGYDTGDGLAAEQSGDASNQVEGGYLYNSPSGENVNLRYTAGVQGFVPQGIPAATPSISTTAALPVVTHYSWNHQNNDDQAGTGDASYSFNIDSDSYKRQETSDARGNIKGSFSYNNEAGTHDLSYIAGENTGFVAISGSLATPDGLGRATEMSTLRDYSSTTTNFPLSSSSQSSIQNADGSYSFGYLTPDSSQQQAGDAKGNVKGSYSYRNLAGTHDLSYVAGADTGFLITGGSLSQLNGLEPLTTYNLANPNAVNVHAASIPVLTSLAGLDGSYKFEYSTDDSSRKEISDANGNVQGSYSYKNQAGNHDLSYVAGSSTGFQVTGGSLSVPNGIKNDNSKNSVSTFLSNPYVVHQVDLYSSSQNDDLANTGDSSYSFSIDTDDYKRSENSDANGNVQGSFSYKNNAGVHDLSFVAGSATGFQPTGGSLYNPSLTSIPTKSNSGNEQSTGDASYNFSIDTDQYKRTESSDASGNVIGNFLYKNSVGQHDLLYKAGAGTGFLATGGSLSVPPGLTENQLRSGIGSQISYSRPLVNSHISTITPNVVAPLNKNTYSIGNVVVNSYLPPSNEKKKFGYIFDTKY